MQREVKVGLLVVVAFVILGVAVFLVSERRNFFALKNRYYIQFETVLGLAPGSPALLNGVTVGSVKRVVLPESVDEEMLTVWINVDRRYGDRVREDSTARIKTLGLLGDKFIEISSGSADSPFLKTKRWSLNSEGIPTIFLHMNIVMHCQTKEQLRSDPI